MKRLLSILLFALPLLSKAQILTTIAGTGTWSCSPDGMPATTTNIGELNCVAVDTNGNIYFSSVTCRNVRKISPSGVITTVAGTGASGSGGDGGPATAATFASPYGLAIDKFGNLYISDNGYNVIRKVSPGGTISTIAGSPSGVGGYGGDGGPASTALLNYPEGLCVDTAGNLYVADSWNGLVRRISTSGTITRFAGTGAYTYDGDGAAATLAGLQEPKGVAADKHGNIYVTDAASNTVRRIDAGGIIHRVAGAGGTMGFSGNGGPATAATLGVPTDVAVDSKGNVYIVEVHNAMVRKVDTNGIINQFAGTGVNGHFGDGGVAFESELSTPQGICLDKNGFKYVAEVEGAYLRKIDTCTVPNVGHISGDSIVCVGSSFSVSDTFCSGTWSSSDSSIASISSAGVVHGLASGMVTISYSATNACASQRATTTVSVGPYAGPILSAWQGIQGVFDTFCYTAMLYTTASFAGGTWGVTNPAVATITASGSLTPLMFGQPDTAYYIHSDACGTDTTELGFILRWCPDQVAPTVAKHLLLETYPNPATDELTVEYSEPISSVELYDVLGQKVLNASYTTDKVTLNLSHIPAGVYVMVLNRQQTSRLVKQ